MHIIIQILYFLIGLGSCVLDYFMINYFRYDHYRAYYRYIAEYTEIGDLVVFIIFLLIGIFVECGLVKDIESMDDWTFTVRVFFAFSIILSLFRIFAMTNLAIHVHPGRIDFMGMFLVLVLLYVIMQFGISMGYAQGLIYRIEDLKDKLRKPHKPAPITWFP